MEPYDQEELHDPEQIDEDSEFILPPFNLEVPSQPVTYSEFYRSPITSPPTTNLATTPIYQRRSRFVPSTSPTEYPAYPVATRPLFSIFHNIPPLFRHHRPQMPRAPHIDLRGSQRMSPANPSSMAVETRHASMTSPIRPTWDPEHDVLIEETKGKGYSKRTGAFKPPFKHRRSPPAQHPKTVSVTVIQPSTSTYSRATDSVAKSERSSTETTTSHSQVSSERGKSSEDYGSPYPPSFPADPTYSLHVAVECHRATQQDADGDTPLHIAISQADEIEISLIRHLICLVSMSGRSVDIYNYVQQTPLHIAVITDNSDVTRLLLEAGANPNETDRNGLTAVHHACVNSSIICLKTILDRSKFTVDLNSRNYNGFAPLHATVMDDNMEMTNALLAAGASVEVQDAKNGWSPLFHAVINQKQSMITRLIEAGAQVNAQSYSGNTALHVATGRGYTDVVRLLMRYGADMSVRNTHRESPAMMSNDGVITTILQARGSAPSPMSYHNAPHIRVPVRQRPEVNTPHPLSEMMHKRRSASRKSNKSGSQQPLPLVKHMRESSGGHRHSTCPSPLKYSQDREHSQSLHSPKKLMIDESRASENKATASTPSSRHKRMKAEEEASSCRVSVIVKRNTWHPQTEEEDQQRTESREAKKPRHRMPRVSQLLAQRSVTCGKEDIKDFVLKPLPEFERSSEKAKATGTKISEDIDEKSKSKEMPVLKPSSPVILKLITEEDKEKEFDANEMPALELSSPSPSPPPSSSEASPERPSASVVVAEENKEDIFTDDPPSPILEMSDAEDEDEPIVEEKSSPKRSHEAAFDDNDNDDEQKKRLCKDNNANDVTN